MEFGASGATGRRLMLAPPKEGQVESACLQVLLSLESHPIPERWKSSDCSSEVLQLAFEEGKIHYCGHHQSEFNSGKIKTEIATLNYVTNGHFCISYFLLFTL